MKCFNKWKLYPLLIYRIIKVDFHESFTYGQTRAVTLNTPSQPCINLRIPYKEEHRLLNCTSSLVQVPQDLTSSIFFLLLFPSSFETDISPMVSLPDFCFVFSLRSCFHVYTLFLHRVAPWTSMASPLDPLVSEFPFQHPSPSLVWDMNCINWCCIPGT